MTNNMRKAHNILFLHFSTLEVELHGNTLEVPRCDYRGGATVFLQSSDMI